MEITSAKYIQNEMGENCVVETTIDGVTMHVPMSPGNRHYDAILEWITEGNTPQPAD